MASEGRRLLGEHYGEEHIAYDRIGELGLQGVTEEGKTIPPGETRNKVFRFEGPDEPSGYLASPMKILCCLQGAS